MKKRFIFIVVLVSFIIILIPSAALADVGETGQDSNGFAWVETPNNTAKIIYYSGSTADIVVPSTVTNALGTSLTVTEIDSRAFHSSSLTGSVTIPAAVTTINPQAFGFNASLTAVVFESGSVLQSIGVDAFYGCDLSSITIPASVTEILDGAFARNSNLTQLLFESGSSLTSIGQSAFNGCDINSVIIPSSVQSIGGDAFESNSSLSSLTFENGSVLQFIGMGAFSNCNLSTVTMPDSLIYLDNQVYYNNPMTSFVLPNSGTWETGIWAGPSTTEHNAGDTVTDLEVSYVHNPSVVISSTAPDPVTSDFDITITFSEDVNDFYIGDVTVMNGVAYNLLGSGTIYTASIATSDDGIINVDIAEKVCGNMYGGRNTEAVQLSRTYDTTAPTVEITAPDPVSGMFIATFTFSEDVIGFELGDITVGNGTAANLSSTTATSNIYTAEITPLSDGEVTIDVLESVCQDAAGHNNRASQYRVMCETVEPRLEITAPDDTTNGDFVATFTFSEDVTGFELSDILVTNGTPSNFTGSGAVYTVDIAAALGDWVDINVAYGSAQDDAGNNSQHGGLRTRYCTLTYDSNGGSGSAPPIIKAVGASVTLHNGVGFTRDGFIIDGWQIESNTVMLGSLVYSDGFDHTAMAIWAADSDGDGISDEDELNCGTYPNDADDIPHLIDINGNVSQLNGAPASGIEVVLNSTPRITVTDANGNFSFSNVYAHEHTISFRRSDSVLALYTLNLNNTGSSSVSITDDASTDSVGAVSGTLGSNVTSLNISFAQNGLSHWQILGAEYSFIPLNTSDTKLLITNPKTGDANRNNLWWIWILAGICLMGLGIFTYQFFKRKHVNR